MPKKQGTSRRRKTPLRTCMACRQVRDKRDLIRIVRTEADGVQIDPSGKRNGRGAYICKDPAQCNNALTRDMVNRALRTHLSEADWRELQGQLMQA